MHPPRRTSHGRAYFSVYYYTKYVLLKASRATLKTKMCNIKLATQTIVHIIWCKTVADALKINVLNTKTSSALGGWLCPLDSRWGLCPQTPVIGSRSRAHHLCVYYLKILRIGPEPWSCVSVCVRVCPSATSRCSTKTAKCRITQNHHTIAQGL